MKQLGSIVVAIGVASMLTHGPSLCAQEKNADSELVGLLVELLQDNDKDVRALALQQIRTQAAGIEASRRFAALLKEMPPDVQPGMLSALADRGDAAARPAVLELLQSDRDQAVRVAAIKALGQLGAPQDCGLLVGLLLKGSKAEQAAVRDALVRIGGSDAVASLIAEMRTATPAVRVALTKILVERRARDAISELIEGSLGDDPSVRAESMQGLGKLAESEHVESMLRGVLRAESGSERVAAEKAVMFVCARIDDADTRADPVLQGMQGMSRADRLVAMSTLGRVGGMRALRVVEEAVASRNRDEHAAGIRALSNWPDGSVAPNLISLVKTDKHPSHRITALRALIRIAPLPDGRTDDQKLKLLKQAMDLCTRDEERQLALRRTSAIRSLKTLQFVLPYLDQPRYAQQACLTIVELAHHRGLREPNEADFHVALDRVIEISQDAVVRDRAQRYKKDQTWVRPGK